MNFTTEKVSSNYTIEVTVEQMLAIIARDETEVTEDCLFARLARIDGIEDAVEYDGHFGPFVFVTIRDEEDEPNTWETILQTIDEYLGVL